MAAKNDLESDLLSIADQKNPVFALCLSEGFFVSGYGCKCYYVCGQGHFYSKKGRKWQISPETFLFLTFDGVFGACLYGGG